MEDRETRGVRVREIPARTQHCRPAPPFPQEGSPPGWLQLCSGAVLLASTGVTREPGHAPPPGWSYFPGHSPSVGPYDGACP